MKKIWYYNANKNFGDLINKDYFNVYLGKYKTVKKVKNSDILMVGSLMDMISTNKLSIEQFLKKVFKPKVDIIGSGFIKPCPYKKERFIRRLNIIGIRGKLSYQRMKALGYNVKDTVLGDWGLIIDSFYNINVKTKKYDVGIIPHYKDKKLTNVKKLKTKYKNSKIIDIQSDPEEFIKEMLECKTIISSAMHGLITADAYGIPNTWIQFSDKLVGGNYKFKDYYSVFDLDAKSIILKDLDKVKNLKNYIEKNYKVDPKKLKKIKKTLITTFNKNSATKI